MRLPGEVRERYGLYRNLVRECETTRDDRASRALRQRTAYLTGSEDIGAPTLYNGLKEYVKDASSQLYSPSAVRWGVVYPPIRGDEFHAELQALTTEAHRLWHDTGMTLTFAEGVKWALTLGVSIFKVIVSDNDLVLDLIPDPSDLGVWNETASLQDQEVLCHYYDLPLARFERIADGFPPDKRNRMLEAARENSRPAKASLQGMPPAMGQIILTTSAGTIPGGVIRRTLDMPWTTGSALEPCVPMAELWVRDDAATCFRRVGMCEHMPVDIDVLWEPFAGEQYDDGHPFHQLGFEYVPGYIWPLSRMDDMVNVTAWEQARWANLDKFMQLQLDPSYFVRGLQGRDGEKMLRARAPGGEVSSNDPTAEVKSLAPPAALAGDMIGFIDKIRQLRDRMAALGPGSRGEAQPGIRGGDQEAVLLGESTVRAMTDAAQIEACAGAIMTQMLRLERRRSGHALVKSTGEKFLLSQIPADFVARVIAHSASPVYALKMRQIAMILKKENAIGLERFVEMLLPEYADILAPEARKREKAQADAAEKKQEMTEEVVGAKIQRDLARAQKDASGY